MNIALLGAGHFCIPVPVNVPEFCSEVQLLGISWMLSGLTCQLWWEGAEVCFV